MLGASRRPCGCSTRARRADSPAPEVTGHSDSSSRAVPGFRGGASSPVSVPFARGRHPAASSSLLRGPLTPRDPRRRYVVSLGRRSMFRLPSRSSDLFRSISRTWAEVDRFPADRGDVSGGSLRRWTVTST
ncbi:hypothetical protein GS506_12740 [Rhodococcus hoagii]|nr:hypothetical protein [Prescottella equi]